MASSLNSKLLKYYLLVALGAVSSALTYLLGQSVISETTIISSILIAVTFTIHDLEQSGSQNGQQ
jgi:hypothetical protein